MTSLVKFKKLTGIPPVEDREFSCIYLIKPNAAVDAGELYVTNSTSTDLVQISTEALTTAISTKVNILQNPLAIGIGYKDNTTSITAGENVAYTRCPRQFGCTHIRASVNAPSSTGPVKLDIKNNGVSILPTVLNTTTGLYEPKYLQIEQGDERSATSTVQFPNFYHVFTSDAKISIDVVEAGVGATGLIVTLVEGLQP